MDQFQNNADVVRGKKTTRVVATMYHPSSTRDNKVLPAAFLVQRSVHTATIPCSPASDPFAVPAGMNGPIAQPRGAVINSSYQDALVNNATPIPQTPDQ